MGVHHTEDKIIKHYWNSTRQLIQSGCLGYRALSALVCSGEYLKSLKMAALSRFSSGSLEDLSLLLGE